MFRELYSVFTISLNPVNNSLKVETTNSNGQMWKWAQTRETANTYWRRNPNPSLLTPKLCIETTAPMAFYDCPITLQFASGCFLFIPNCLTLSVKITRETQAVFHICLSIGGKGQKKNHSASVITKNKK